MNANNSFSNPYAAAEWSKTAFDGTVTVSYVCDLCHARHSDSCGIELSYDLPYESAHIRRKLCADCAMRLHTALSALTGALMPQQAAGAQQQTAAEPSAEKEGPDIPNLGRMEADRFMGQYGSFNGPVTDMDGIMPWDVPAPDSDDVNPFSMAYLDSLIYAPDDSEDEG